MCGEPGRWIEHRRVELVAARHLMRDLDISQSTNEIPTTLTQVTGNRILLQTYRSTSLQSVTNNVSVSVKSIPLVCIGPSCLDVLV